MNRTVTGLAAHLGMTRQAVNQAIKRGELVRIDGKICDEQPASNKAWIYQRRKSPAHKPVGQSKTREYVPDPAAGGDEPIELNGRSLSDLTNEELTRLPKASIDKLKSLESMLKTQIERQMKRKELIRRDLVGQVFGQIYAIEAATLKPMGAKLSAEVAGICGCEDPALILQVEQRIDGEVAKALKHILHTVDTALENWAPQ